MSYWYDLCIIHSQLSPKVSKLTFSRLRGISYIIEKYFLILWCSKARQSYIKSAPLKFYCHNLYMQVVCENLYTIFLTFPWHISSFPWPKFFLTFSLVSIIWEWGIFEIYRYFDTFFIISCSQKCFLIFPDFLNLNSLTFQTII